MSVLRDILGVGGYAAVVYGIWQMHPPSAWIVGGMLPAGLVMAHYIRLAKSRQRGR
jgi:hypothetical protein